MQTINAKDYYKILKKQAERLLPDSEYKYVVSTQKQHLEIDHLKKTVHYERFFFVLNNYDFSIDHVHGVKKWLGYDEDDFTYYKYLSIIHPTHLLAQLSNVYELLENSMTGVYPLEFINGFRFISYFALRHLSGEYLFFKRLAWPFQYDDKNRLLSYLNEFTLLGKYNNESYTVRLTDADGRPLILKRKKINPVYSAIENMPFSHQELKVLNAYAKDASLTGAAIANTLMIKKNTVITYKKRILDKAEKLFYRRFKTAADVAIFLKEQGLI